MCMEVRGFRRTCCGLLSLCTTWRDDVCMSIDALQADEILNEILNAHWNVWMACGWRRQAAAEVVWMAEVLQWSCCIVSETALEAAALCEGA